MPFNNAHHRWRQIPKRWRWCCCCCGFWSQWSVCLGYLLWYLEHLLKSHSNKNPRSEKNFPSTMRPNGWLAAWLSSADNHRHISYLVRCGLTGDEVEAEDGIGLDGLSGRQWDETCFSVRVCVVFNSFMCITLYSGILLGLGRRYFIVWCGISEGNYVWAKTHGEVSYNNNQTNGAAASAEEEEDTQTPSLLLFVVFFPWFVHLLALLPATTTTIGTARIWCGLKLR